MQELIEQLQRLKQAVPAPLHLPDEDDILEVEEELLVPLADDLKDFLLTVSDVVYGSFEPVTIADPHAHTHLPEVAAVAWERGMPRQLIPLCEYHDGYYAVTEEGAVFLWQPGQYEDVFDEEPLGSVWDWVETVWLASGECE